MGRHQPVGSARGTSSAELVSGTELTGPIILARVDIGTLRAIGKANRVRLPGAASAC